MIYLLNTILYSDASALAAALQRFVQNEVKRTVPAHNLIRLQRWLITVKTQ